MRPLDSVGETSWPPTAYTSSGAGPHTLSRAPLLVPSWRAMSQAPGGASVVPGSVGVVVVAGGSVVVDDAVVVSSAGGVVQAVVQVASTSAARCGRGGMAGQDNAV